MDLQTYKNHLRQKIINNTISNFDKGIDQNGKIIADYPVIEKVGSSNFVDANGDINRLKELKTKLEEQNLFYKFQIRYIPQRTNIYCEVCKEFGIPPRLYNE